MLVKKNSYIVELSLSEMEQTVPQAIIEDAVTRALAPFSKKVSLKSCVLDKDACDTDSVSVVSFNCKTKEELAKYTDSMLFDSVSLDPDGNIAAGCFVCGGKSLTITLDIVGEVSVTYKGKHYDRPSEFPEDLKAYIRNHRDDLMLEVSENAEEVPEITMNNWFEYQWDYCGMVADDICHDTPKTILSDMLDIAKEYFEKSGS